MRFRMQTASLAAIVGGAIFITGAAQASWTLGHGDTLNLGDVFAEGSDRTVFIDDKVFYFESVASQHFLTNDFTLIGFISENPGHGGFRNVGFDIVGGFGDANPGDGVIAEMNLQYNVSVNQRAYEQGLRLCDARLTFNGSTFGTGSFSRVDETIFDLDTNTLLGGLSVYDNYGPPRTTKYVDEQDFCVGDAMGFRAFEVNKNLKFLAPQEGSAASASFVRQEFSQVPAPGAVALLTLAGLAGRRRRG